MRIQPALPWLVHWLASLPVRRFLPAQAFGAVHQRCLHYLGWSRVWTTPGWQALLAENTANGLGYSVGNKLTVGTGTVQPTGIVGAYGGFVYLSTVLGGWVADRVLGMERTVFYGGVVVMCGHLALAILPGKPSAFILPSSSLMNFSADWGSVSRPSVKTWMNTFWVGK